MVSYFRSVIGKDISKADKGNRTENEKAIMHTKRS